MKVNLIIRQCDACGHEAVPLDGEGTDCIDCEGKYAEQTGVKTVEVSRLNGTMFKKTNPEAVDS